MYPEGMQLVAETRSEIAQQREFQTRFSRRHKWNLVLAKNNEPAA